jgi:hypothetical protein
MKPALLVLLVLGSTPALAGSVEPTPAQIDAAIAKADLDGNGSVGFGEAKKFGITPDMFRKANTDRDGALDKRQFAAALAYQFAFIAPNGDKKLDWKNASRAGVRSKQVFDAADPDHDGKLDLAEYVAAMAAQAKK